MKLSSAIAGEQAGPLPATIDARWLMAYSAGLGETDARYYDTEAGVLAHPLFPVCYEWPVAQPLRALPALKPLFRLNSNRVSASGLTLEARIESFLAARATASPRSWRSLRLSASSCASAAATADTKEESDAQPRTELPRRPDLPRPTLLDRFGDPGEAPGGPPRRGNAHSGERRGRNGVKRRTAPDITQPARCRAPAHGLSLPRIVPAAGVTRTGRRVQTALQRRCNAIAPGRSVEPPPRSATLAIP